MDIRPPQLRALFLFHPYLGDESTEHRKIVYFWPERLDVPVQCDFVGVAGALINFTSQFGDSRSTIKSVRLKKHRFVFLRCEGEFWLVMVLINPKLVPSAEQKGSGGQNAPVEEESPERAALRKRVEARKAQARAKTGVSADDPAGVHLRDELSDPMLRELLLRVYVAFKLFHGSFHELSLKGLMRLRLRLWFHLLQHRHRALTDAVKTMDSGGDEDVDEHWEAFRKLYRECGDDSDVDKRRDVWSGLYAALRQPPSEMPATLTYAPCPISIMQSASLFVRQCPFALHKGEGEEKVEMSSASLVMGMPWEVLVAGGESQEESKLGEQLSTVPSLDTMTPKPVSDRRMEKYLKWELYTAMKLLRRRFACFMRWYLPTLFAQLQYPTVYGSVFSGFRFFPLNPYPFLTVQYLVATLRQCFPSICGVQVSFQQQLVWSDLPLPLARAIHMTGCHWQCNPHVQEDYHSRTIENGEYIEGRAYAPPLPPTHLRIGAFMSEEEIRSREQADSSTGLIIGEGQNEETARQAMLERQKQEQQVAGSQFSQEGTGQPGQGSPTDTLEVALVLDEKGRFYPTRTQNPLSWAVCHPAVLSHLQGVQRDTATGLDETVTRTVANADGAEQTPAQQTGSAPSPQPTEGDGGAPSQAKPRRKKRKKTRRTRKRYYYSAPFVPMASGGGAYTRSFVSYLMLLEQERSQEEFVVFRLYQRALSRVSGICQLWDRCVEAISKPGSRQDEASPSPAEDEKIPPVPTDVNPAAPGSAEGPGPVRRTRARSHSELNARLAQEARLRRAGKSTAGPLEFHAPRVFLSADQRIGGSDDHVHELIRAFELNGKPAREKQPVASDGAPVGFDAVFPHAQIGAENGVMSPVERMAWAEQARQQGCKPKKQGVCSVCPPAWALQPATRLLYVEMMGLTLWLLVRDMPQKAVLKQQSTSGSSTSTTGAFNWMHSAPPPPPSRGLRPPKRLREAIMRVIFPICVDLSSMFSRSLLVASSGGTDGTEGKSSATESLPYRFIYFNGLNMAFRQEVSPSPLIHRTVHHERWRAMLKAQPGSEPKLPGKELFTANGPNRTLSKGADNAPGPRRKQSLSVYDLWNDIGQAETVSQARKSIAAKYQGGMSSQELNTLISQWGHVGVNITDRGLPVTVRSQRSVHPKDAKERDHADVTETRVTSLHVSAPPSLYHAGSWSFVRPPAYLSWVMQDPWYNMTDAVGFKRVDAREVVRTRVATQAAPVGDSTKENGNQSAKDEEKGDGMMQTVTTQVVRKVTTETQAGYFAVPCYVGDSGSSLRLSELQLAMDAHERLHSCLPDDPCDGQSAGGDALLREWTLAVQKPPGYVSSAALYQVANVLGSVVNATQIMEALHGSGKQGEEKSKGAAESKVKTTVPFVSKVAQCPPNALQARELSLLREMDFHVPGTGWVMVRRSVQSQREVLLFTKRKEKSRKGGSGSATDALNAIHELDRMALGSIFPY